MNPAWWFLIVYIIGFVITFVTMMISIQGESPGFDDSEDDVIYILVLFLWPILWIGLFIWGVFHTGEFTADFRDWRNDRKTRHMTGQPDIHSSDKPNDIAIS